MQNNDTFEQFGRGRENNFDFLRYFFAVMVIFAHSFAFLYNGSLAGYDPLVRLTGGQEGLGGLAVGSFFLISGFLITQSWTRSKSLADFARKRALRIFPALVTVLLFSIFIVGPLATTNLAAYFHNPRTYQYFWFMLHPNLHVYDKLPGVFGTNPLPWRVNGSLWTIRYELVCYAMVAIFGLAGLYRKPTLVFVLAVLPFVGHLLIVRHLFSAGSLEDLFYLLAYFMTGMLAYLYRDSLPYSGRLAGLCAVILVIACRLQLLPLVAPLGIGYLLFYVAFNPAIRLQNFAHHGDFSYGVYLYACPVQQLLVLYYQPLFNPFTLALISLSASTLIAMGSWHWVEKPFMKRKSRSEQLHPAVGEVPASPSILPQEVRT